MAEPSTSTGTGSSTGPDTVGQAEAAVEQSREQLAATVRALHERTDVKARAGGWAAQHRTTLLGAAGAAVVAVALLVVVRRRR